MIRFLCVNSLASCALFANSSGAATIFESGTLGATGVQWSSVENGTVPAITVDQFDFPGVRFYVDQQAMVSQIGGHFAAKSNGTFFGAIVALDTRR